MKRHGGTTSLVDSRQVESFDDSGAATWTSRLTVASPALDVEVTGDTSGDIDWTAFVTPTWRVS